MPVYNVTPNAADRISETQDPIKTNFASIGTVVAVNHNAIDGANAGMHKFLQMPEQGAAPTTAANTGAIYTKVGADSAVTELAFRREGDGSVIEMTAKGASWTWLPSGILMHWGQNSWTGTQTAIAANAGPKFTTVYSVLLTPTNGFPNGLIRFVSATVIPGTRVDLECRGFDLNNADAAAQAKYLIIGV